MYKLIFKPVSTPKKVKKKTVKKIIQKPYSAFEGKPIRKITIETLDPFMNSLTGTPSSSQTFLHKAANKIHIKSQEINIRNLLLIRKNQPFDSLLVKESERLIRRQEYVHEVAFTVTQRKDSVDILIRELDNWSLIPKVSAGSSMTVALEDKNFLGLGHLSRNGISWFQNTSRFGYDIYYLIPNIRNTYINSSFRFSSDRFNNTFRSFAIDRPFFSPYAKWAAGISLTQEFRRNNLNSFDSLFSHQQLRFNTQDFWVGDALQIFKGDLENNRSTNFISSLRFLRIRYIDKPEKEPDRDEQFLSENFYLASIGITTRKFVQDHYIFKYGLTEDVPIGQVFSITGGYQVKSNANRLYLGGRISFGNYYSWGYLSTNLEAGTFFHASLAEQGVVSLSLNYFTRLFEIGRWKFREFIKPQFTLGINRFSYDSLTLNSGYGLEGFNSSALTGTRRILFTIQTQSYAPWKVIGFRFGPYINFSMGVLGDAQSGFRKSRAYSQIGLGILFKNENLIFSSFQLSVSFYPAIPGKGSILKTNAIKAGDIGLRDFEIGKPSTVAFQ